jgi:tRNA G18 (ribose-2'-O)-methylase SpoU
MRRPLVGVDGGTTVVGAPLSLYSKEAMSVLGGSELYLAMGAEDNGLPDAFIARCTSLVSIPCLSASINVSCAFSMVLAVCQLSSIMRAKENEETRSEGGEES